MGLREPRINKLDVSNTFVRGPCNNFVTRAVFFPTDSRRKGSQICEDQTIQIVTKSAKISGNIGENPREKQ